MVNIAEKIAQAKTENRYIDYYCERIAGDDSIISSIHFIGEPLNTITNLAFIIAGIFVLRLIFKLNFFQNHPALSSQKLDFVSFPKESVTKSSILDPKTTSSWIPAFTGMKMLRNLDIILLCLNLFLIGIGSAIYHAKPNAETVLMDVIPITFFMHLYVVSFLARVGEFKIWQIIVALCAFIYSNYWAGANLNPQILNGTIMYIPAFTTLCFMVLLAFIKKNANAKYIAITAVIWAVSLTFRTIDVPTCELTQGIGTHVIWHILNSVVLYRLVKSLISSNFKHQTFN